MAALFLLWARMRAQSIELALVSDIWPLSTKSCAYIQLELLKSWVEDNLDLYKVRCLF